MFDDRLKDLKAKQQNKRDGSFNCIPFSENFPTLSKYLPGVMKGVQYLITANSGIGKTQLAKYMFVKTPYDFIKKHPETGLKLKILYFAIEESKEEFIDTLIVAHLAEKYKINIDVLDLNSMYDTEVSDDIIAKVEGTREYFAELFDSVEIIDSVSNPYGIYKYCREYSNKNGTHYWTQLKIKDEGNRKFITHQEYEAADNNKGNWKYSHYKQDDENEYVVIITDHISLLQPERAHGGSLHKTMTAWSADYCRKQITKHWKYSIVNIQQQAAASENVEHYKSSRLEPSLDNLGDNKLTQRDALVVIGLFAPYRYKIQNYLGYDITRLKDNFRSLIILKNRIGRPNLNLALYFDGAINKFKELPNPQSYDRMEKVYSLIEKNNK
jgi:replicative DNA helicase